MAKRTKSQAEGMLKKIISAQAQDIRNGESDWAKKPEIYKIFGEWRVRISSLDIERTEEKLAKLFATHAIDIEMVY